MLIWLSHTEALKLLTSRYGRNGKSYPMMLIAYDSRVDKISKIKESISPTTPIVITTPEGLCFEAVMKEIEPSS